ncbi:MULTISPECIES: hypothetical protein [unclassified Streptomyces]|uniref:hypothetical protein n=1 Tax=unclassified Streptomyces TaxID=2593676 RepID=UPI0001C197E4|nr:MULTISPECIES: hypothetical protein [unclassified Streptomyces]AEN11749.1 conserved hypothetical protein [Streptomyces sp. SirexAA-E]MYR70005.1 hypothetical protein [Streptomyces sp. SID4939]MYR99145.1 hypothetical protein [Streptomyces sp. SID4940]MYT61728.1 hypothetical protein [Streptomyces sp. SID8357]MYT85097.1 hypothetical protein [Streptomyces sp. SID8360]
MSVERGLPSRPGLPPVPAPGTLVVDTQRGDRVGEFRGVAGPYWSLRPVRGGAEWEADPAHVRPADAREHLHAATAIANRRSAGEWL